MAPSHSRQLLIWTVPTIAVILGYFWYRRKRLSSKTDPGEIVKAVETPPKPVDSGSPRTFSRSLSGVDSAPIDIVIPHKLKATKSNPVVISDEDLDIEIEKIKSMRYNGSIDMRKSNSCSETTTKKGSPKKLSPVMAQTPVEEKAPVVEDGKDERSSANNEVQRQNCERDSANHSPADVMLASPSLSSISDNQSEVSS